MAAAAGFGFRAEQSRGRRMLRTYAVSEEAAAAAAESCGKLRRWDRPSNGFYRFGCTINISKATLCRYYHLPFAESPCSRFKWPSATCRSKKQATGWRFMWMCFCYNVIKNIVQLRLVSTEKFQRFQLRAVGPAVRFKQADE